MNNLPIAAEHIILKFLINPSLQNASFLSPPSSLLLPPKHFCNLGVIIRLQYEYTPKYNPTLGILPNALTTNPEYKFNIPPGLEVIIFVAWYNDIDDSVWTCCWTVFIVSNGASIVLEHAAARPDASVFFRPCFSAVDDHELVLEDDHNFPVVVDDDFVVWPPARGRFSVFAFDGWWMCTSLVNNFADEVCERRHSDASIKIWITLILDDVRVASCNEVALERARELISVALLMQTEYANSLKEDVRSDDGQVTYLSH